MAGPRPNMRSVRFVSFLYVCCCFLSAVSQRQSVCGFGPHKLNLTGLDTFVLQGSYVMLQPIRNTQSSRIMTWSTSDNRRTLLQSGSTKQPNNSLKIGPMKKDFNRLYVRYTYQLGSGGVAQYVSNTAVLYMAAKDFDIVPKANSVFNQLVQVGTGAERRVICYRLIPRAQDNDSYVPPTQRSLTKQLLGTAITGYSTVPGERYFFREGCLWMRSLQQTDSGKYSLRIRDCFSSQFKATVNFSLSVDQALVTPRSTYLSIQHSLPLSHRSAEGTIPSRIIKQPTLATLTATAPTGIRLFSTFMPLPKELLLTLSLVGGHMMSGCLTVYMAVNETLNITYNLNGGVRQRVEVHRNGQVAERVVVRKETFVTVEKVQQSDSGQYQVIARVEGANVTSNFTLIIQQESETTSSTTLSSRTDRLSNRTITETPSGCAKMGNASDSHNSTAQTEGIQGLVVGISIPLILLLLLIPTVYLSYKHRHTLQLFCVRSKPTLKGDTVRQQSNPAYWSSTYGKSTIIPNSDTTETTADTLHCTNRSTTNQTTTDNPMKSTGAEDTGHDQPDIIMASNAKSTIAKLLNNRENGTVQSFDEANYSDLTPVQMPVYAIVHNGQKTVRDTSSMTKQRETKPPQPQDSHNDDLASSMMDMPIYTTVYSKKNTTTRFPTTHDNVGPNDGFLNRQRIEDGRKTPQRPAPYIEASSTKCQSSVRATGDSNVIVELSGKKEGEYDDPAVVLAALSSPTATGKQDLAKAATQEQ